MNRKLYITILIIVFALASSYFLSLCVCNLQNTLDKRGHWESSKVELKRGCVGALAFMKYRVSLAKNQLNLSAWHGFQEVNLKNNFKYDSLRFKFKLSTEKSYLVFFFGQDQKNRIGVRLSRNHFLKSSFIVANEKGQFIFKEPLEDFGKLKEMGFVELKYHENSIYIKVNGEKVMVPERFRKYAKTKIVSFRAGYQQVNLDQVELFSFGRQIFKDDFSNRNGFWAYWGSFLGLILLFILAVTGNKKEALYSSVLVAFLSYGVMKIDYNFFSLLYPRLIKKKFMTHNMESEDRINEIVKSYYQKNGPLILLLGTSQTWGAGAAKVGESFGEILQKKIEEVSPYFLVNASISGWESSRLFRDYSKKWIQLKPEVVLINLGHNDKDEMLFEKNLINLVRLNQHKGIKTGFILEANSSESSLDKINRFHEVMKKVASKFSIPVLDLHQYILNHHDSGFLWWDVVHFSSYAHELAADFLFSEIRQNDGYFDLRRIKR